MRTAPSSGTRPGMSAPGVCAPRAAARALGGDRSSVPLGRPATAGACSTPSLWMWSLVTRSPVISPRRSPACRMCTPLPATPECHWALRSPLPRTPEASGGQPRNTPQPGVTTGENEAPTCQPWALPPLCSSPYTSDPYSRAQGPMTADTVLMGAAPMATRRLSGHSGKAALGSPVSRAGTGAALTGYLSLRGPITLAAQSCTAVTAPGAGPGQGQWLLQSTTPTSPRPSRMSPVSAGAPSLAVAMTTWPLQLVLLGKAVWASPAMPTLCGACCPVPMALVQTGLPAGTSLLLWANVTASGMAAAMAMPITSPRSKSA